MSVHRFCILAGENIFLFFKTPRQPMGPPSLLLNGHYGSLPLVKRPGREFDHSPSSSVEVKNEWSYTSTPPICLMWTEITLLLPYSTYTFT